jgi:hypothetical protein
MKNPAMVASQRNYETASGDHFWRPSKPDTSGMIRNQGFLFGFSLFAGMKNLLYVKHSLKKSW